MTEPTVPEHERDVAAGDRAAGKPLGEPLEEVEEPEESVYWSDTQVLQVLRDAHGAGSSPTQAIREHESEVRAGMQSGAEARPVARATASERPRAGFFARLMAIFRRKSS